MTASEVKLVLAGLADPYRLMCELIYAGGLRMEECLSLRVMDLDFEQQTVTVRSGKGGKDRLTLPAHPARTRQGCGGPGGVRPNGRKEPRSSPVTQWEHPLPPRSWGSLGQAPVLAICFVHEARRRLEAAPGAGSSRAEQLFARVRGVRGEAYAEFAQPRLVAGRGHVTQVRLAAG
jgi:integrase